MQAISGWSQTPGFLNYKTSIMNLAMLYPRILFEHHIKMSRSYAVLLHAFEFNYVPFVYFHHPRKWVKKILLWFMSKSILYIFSSKSFIVSSLTFRSLIHFEFIFVCGVRECSSFIVFLVAILFSQDHLLKRLSFFLYSLLPLS